MIKCRISLTQTIVTLEMLYQCDDAGMRQTRLLARLRNTNECFDCPNILPCTKECGASPSRDKLSTQEARSSSEQRN